MKNNINEVTIMQRLEMLKNPPAKPVSGRGFERVRIDAELGKDHEAVVAKILSGKINTPHLAAVSVREAVNSFGRLGTPKIVFCSPEFYNLF